MIQFEFSPSQILSYMIIENPEIVNGIDIGVRSVEVIEDNIPIFHGYLNHGNVQLIIYFDIGHPNSHSISYGSKCISSVLI